MDLLESLSATEDEYTLEKMILVESAYAYAHAEREYGLETGESGNLFRSVPKTANRSYAETPQNEDRFISLAKQQGIDL